MLHTIKCLALALLLTCGGGLVPEAWGQSSVTGNITESSSTCGVGGSTNGVVKIHFPVSSSFIPGSASVTVSGTFSGTLSFGQSADNGLNWTLISGYPQPSGATVTSATAAGLWAFDVAGRTDLCVWASSYSSGTAVTTVRVSAASFNPPSGIPIPTFNLQAPVVGDSGKFQVTFTRAATITKVYCSTDAGTADINFEIRTLDQPNTTGTSVLSSSLSCPSGSASTTTILNSSIAADRILALIVASTSGSPGILRATAVSE